MGTMADQLAIYTTQAEMSSFFIDKMGLISVKSYGAVGDGATDDTDAIELARDAAAAAGLGGLFFPHGTYKVDASLSLNGYYLWGDNSTFSGISDVINQVGNAKLPETAVNIYVATTGSDTNNGFSASAPLLTLSAAFNKIPNVIGGNYTINLAAGTYSGSSNKGLTIVKSGANINIVGPDVSGGTPTAIIDMGDAGGNGLAFEFCHSVEIEDVKWNNCATSVVLWAIRGTELTCRNVHVNKCAEALRVTNGGNAYWYDGVITSMTTAGLACEFNSFLNAYDPSISGTGAGIFYLKGAQGGVQGGTIDTTGNGIQLNEICYVYVGQSAYGKGNISISNAAYGIAAQWLCVLQSITAQITYTSCSNDKLVEAATFCVDLAT